MATVKAGYLSAVSNSEFCAAAKSGKWALAERSEESDLVGVGFDAFDLHAWRPNWHRGNGKSDRVWPLGQEPLDRDCRHMTFDDVAAHLAGMARVQLSRHAELRL